jgi:hypothetical protein
MKRCKKCGEEKPIQDFYASKGARDGHRPECKVCTSARRKLWYQANRDREIERVRAWQQANHEYYLQKQAEYRRSTARDHRSGHLKRKFGITLEEYERILEKQGGGCAICEDPPNERISLHVDHDHVTGEIRGLLCVRCNNGIGLFRENPDLLKRAARYVTADARFRSARPRLERLVRERAYALRELAA